MAAKAIPPDVRRQVDEIVERFNHETFRGTDIRYVPRYKGLYLYFDRYAWGRGGPICRLRYTGKMDRWEFAIFKYSSERYDPDEWMFPGSEHLDGTIEGALRTGLEAYPP